MLFSRLWSTAPCLGGSLWPLSAPCSHAVLGSTAVLSSGFLQARTVDHRSSTASTRPTKVFPIVLATHRCLHRPVPATTRLRVVLTCPRVNLTLLHVHRPSHSSMSSPPRSSHHAPARGSHAPAHESHAPTRASHAPPCPPRAAARSSSAYLLPPCHLVQLLLNGLFYCFFHFPCIVYFDFCYLFVLFFVGFCLPARMWFDLEKEIDVGGRPLAFF